MRTFTILLFSVTMLGVACTQKNETNPAADAEPDHVVIGVSLLTLTHPFFLNLIDALKTEAVIHGYDVEITSAEFDVARQQHQVSDFIVQKVDAIIISPADSKSIGTSIKAANDAGIPVFTADIAVLATDVSVVSHVGIDNFTGGQMAARAILSQLEDEGEIAIIDHPEVESVIQRTKGFRAVLDSANAAGAHFSIVADLPASGSQDKAFRVMEDILQAHPGVDAVFGINDETALGAVAAIEKEKKQGSVFVVGIGGKTEALEAVDEGRLAADVRTFPEEIGKQVIQSVAAYRAGEAVREKTLIPTALYKPTDAKAANGQAVR